MNVRERPVRERSHEIDTILVSYDRLTVLEFRLTPQESVFGDSKPTPNDLIVILSLKFLLYSQARANPLLSKS